MNTRTLYIALFAITSLSSCQEKNKETTQTDNIQPQAQKVQQVYEVPVEMIKSPNGQVYFPENIHRPKSDRDSVVWVKPSDLK
ncbi:MAG: hypothetical protein WKF66_02195 [Pedobacter sp.]